MGGSFLIVLVLIFGAMYFLMIRPQRKQQATHRDMLANLKAGDEVITVGGIYGDVVSVEPDRVGLEIAEDVEIEVARRAIAQVVQPEGEEGLAEDEEFEETEPVAEVERSGVEARTEGGAQTDEAVEPEREEARR